MSRELPAISSARCLVRNLNVKMQPFYSSIQNIYIWALKNKLSVFHVSIALSCVISVFAIFYLYKKRFFSDLGRTKTFFLTIFTLINTSWISYIAGNILINIVAINKTGLLDAHIGVTVSMVTVSVITTLLISFLPNGITVFASSLVGTCLNFLFAIDYNTIDSNKPFSSKVALYTVPMLISFVVVYAISIFDESQTNADQKEDSNRVANKRQKYKLNRFIYILN